MNYGTDRFEFMVDSDNDCIIGQDGCTYDTEADAMYYAQLNLCGCGCPELVHKLLLDCLKCNEEKRIIPQRIEELVRERPEVVTEFILHFLDSKDLTDHGGSVYSSWLSERGIQFIEVGCMEEK